MIRFLGLVLVGLLGGGCVTGSSVKDYRKSMPDPHASLLDFGVPIQDSTPSVISLFGWRSARRIHEGIDFRASIGTPVLASERGVVLYAGKSLRGYGIMVVIDHGDDWSTSYAHLSRAFVKRGDGVVRGQRIANSGNTGRSSGPHLHFEIRKGADPLDPLMFLRREELRLP